MTINRVPYLVDGPLSAAELWRSAYYTSMGGAEGVTRPGDLAVRALSTPGDGVRVAMGQATINNRYAGGSGQAYAVDNDEDHVVSSIPSTAAARSDLIVARITDPQYAGGTGINPATYQYANILRIQGVSSGTIDASALTYPAYALARIDLPANNNTITQAMIIDLRKVARPRRERYLRAYAVTQGQATTLSNTAAMTWPGVGTWNLDVPEWATVMRVVATWNQVLVPPGNAVGALWVQLGLSTDASVIQTQPVGYNTPGSTQTARSTFEIADDIAVPAGLRGRTIPIFMRGNVLSTTPSASRLVVDGASSIKVDVEFAERATTDS